MKRFLIFVAIGVVVLVTLLTIISHVQRSQEKTKSPEDEVVFATGELRIRVFYNRPFKKGREIFGGLVPYDTVWRTGANEATTFETNRALTIGGQRLPAGKYSLWTIPGQHTWTVIFNSEYGQWGINSKGNANRDPARDVLSAEVPVVLQKEEFEQFTIAFEEIGTDAEMVFMWDRTLVSVPFSY